MKFTKLKWIGLAGMVALSLAACASNKPEPVEDIDSNVARDAFDEDVELRDGELNKAYDTGDTVIQVNEINLLNDDEIDSYFQYQAVRVNATIENTSDEDQRFDVWAQLRVGSVSNRDSFGALQLSVYGLEGYERPELNDDLFIELAAGESVTYDFLYDVIVPEEDNDVQVIYQINPTNHYEDGYIVWEIDGFSELEPSEVVEIDWDAIEEEQEAAEELEGESEDEPEE